MIITYSINGLKDTDTKKDKLFEVNTSYQVGKSLMNELLQKGYYSLFYHHERETYPLIIKELGITIDKIIPGDN